MVDRRPEVTWQELEEQIREKAKAALQAAAAALDSGTIADLRSLAVDRRERIDAELDARDREAGERALNALRGEQPH